MICCRSNRVGEREREWAAWMRMDRESSRMDSEYQFPFLIPKKWTIGYKEFWETGFRLSSGKRRERLLLSYPCHYAIFHLLLLYASSFAFCATNTGHGSGLCLACPEFRQSCFTNTAYSQTLWLWHKEKAEETTTTTRHRSSSSIKSQSKFESPRTVFLTFFLSFLSLFVCR